MTEATIKPTTYLFLPGRSGGQIAYGGKASGEELTLISTTHATKGKINFGLAGSSVYDEVNDRFGFGVTDPDTKVEIFNAGNQLKLSYNDDDTCILAVDDSGDLNITPSGDKVTIMGEIYAPGWGPHAIGGPLATNAILSQGGTIVATAGGSLMGHYQSCTLTAITNVEQMYGTRLSSNVFNTQTETEDVTAIANLRVETPNIYNNLTGGGEITYGSTVSIQGAPTEAVNNHAFWVQSGLTKLGGDLDVTGNLVVSGTGPHAIGGETSSYTQFYQGGAFTSSGASSYAYAYRQDSDLTGVAGDSNLWGAYISNSFVTQAAEEDMNSIYQMMIEHSGIGKNLTGGKVIQYAANLCIGAAPTEAVENYSLHIPSGAVKMGTSLAIGGLPANSVRLTLEGGTWADPGANGRAVMYANSSWGLVMGGQGSTSDFVIASRSGTAVISVAASSVNVGFGVSDPDARVEILSTTDQLKLSYNGTDNTVFAVDDDGDLTVTPSGSNIDFASNVRLSSSKTLDLTGGAYFKPRRIVQSGVPTPEVGELLMWSDTYNNRAVIMFEDADDGTHSLVMDGPP